MQALKVDELAFYKIFNLMRNKPWLSYKSESVLELFNFCETEIQQTLILDLLNRFLFVTSHELNDIGNQIVKQVITQWNLNYSNSLFIATADDSNQVDGSQGYLNSLKDKFAIYDWSGSNFINSIGAGRYTVQKNNTAILFDDFVGSGETIRRKYSWFQKKMTEMKKDNVNIKIVSYAIMESAYNDLVSEGYDIFSPVKVKKGISEYDSYTIDQKKEYLEAMMTLEDKLEQISKGLSIKAYSLGYNRSEAIYGVEGNNISDNVFPILWWPEKQPNKKRIPLFNRLN